MNKPRAELMRRLQSAAARMIQGSLSQTYRKCGHPGCRCHRGEPHGPHTYLTFRTPEGRSSGRYVPAARLAEAQEAVAAWQEFWEVAVELAARNRDEAAQRWRVGPLRRRRRVDDPSR